MIVFLLAIRANYIVSIAVADVPWSGS